MKRLNYDPYYPIPRTKNNFIAYKLETVVKRVTYYGNFCYVRRCTLGEVDRALDFIYRPLKYKILEWNV